MAKATTIKITLVKSTIGEKPKIRATVESLGLRKIRQSVERPDSPSLRGMIFHAKHLLEVEESK
jgi:large subunit ribosomal protein L30